MALDWSLPQPVLRDAACVYAEGVIHGLELALRSMARGKSPNEALDEWRAKLAAAQRREEHAR